MNTITKDTDLSEYFCVAELLFNRITIEYNKLNCNNAKLELLFELFVEELNNKLDNIDNLDCFDATVLEYENFADYFSCELI